MILKLLVAIMPAIMVAAVATPEGQQQSPHLLRADPPITSVIKASTADLFLEDVIEPIIEKERRKLLGTCQGDCDTDSQCSGSLVCCQRNAGDPVPCCPHIGTGGRTDFCAASSCCRGGGGGGGGGGDSVDVGIIACFSGQTTVEVLGKGTVPLKDLQVGDCILTGSSSYETVYAFGHYQPLETAEFLLIHTNDDQVLEVTKDHLVYRQGFITEEQHPPVRAGTIQVGDKLQPNGALVTHIGKKTSAGIFTPLVPSGEFLVNSNHLRVSSYSALVQDGRSAYPYFQDGTPLPISQHSWIHLVLTPFRVYCQFSIIQGSENAGACHPSSYTVAGLPRYVSVGIDILTWADQQPLVVQWFLLVLALLIFGATFLVEQIVFYQSPVLAQLSTISALVGMISYKTYHYYLLANEKRTGRKKKVY